MKCSAVRAFLSEIGDREESIAPIPDADLDYLCANGLVLKSAKEDYDKGVAEVARLSQLVAQVNQGKSEEEQAAAVLRQDERKEHSFLFHFAGGTEKSALQERVQGETAAVAREESELNAMESSLNQLIQERSNIDRMVTYGGGYLSLTGAGTILLNDLGVRNYRVSDIEFPDFLAEAKAIYAELRAIADKAARYVELLRPRVPGIRDPGAMRERGVDDEEYQANSPSLLWGPAIGLAKLQGDPDQIGGRFIQALDGLLHLDSTIANKLMAAEIMTASGSQDIPTLESALEALVKQVRAQDVPKELAAGVAAVIMAGRRFDGTYPTEQFAHVRQLTQSCEAASILAVMNVPQVSLISRFQTFRLLFTNWGYMESEDTEIASAFLTTGALEANEVDAKLRYIVEQLRNYLEYPLVAAAILASIPVFDSHEVLDLMEKAVTLLSGYAVGLERSELVALAVRMVHGVRNELVKEIDATAKIAGTPVQFTYSSHPGMFIWYQPLIVAHSSYHSTFSGMGGFHPAHSHGIGGFAG